MFAAVHCQEQRTKEIKLDTSNLRQCESLTFTNMIMYHVGNPFIFAWERLLSPKRTVLISKENISLVHCLNVVVMLP